LTAFAAALAGCICSNPAAAQEHSFNLTIGESHFEPSTLRVPSGVKLQLHVRNARSGPAEFESSELNREKVIAPGSSSVIYVGPLAPGTYGFFDDFKPSIRGQLIAK
jgi:Cupredoxin-like domain